MSKHAEWAAIFGRIQDMFSRLRTEIGITLQEHHAAVLEENRRWTEAESSIRRRLDDQDDRMDKIQAQLAALERELSALVPDDSGPI